MDSGTIVVSIGAFLFGLLLLVIIYAAIANSVSPIPPPNPSCSDIEPSFTIPSDYPTCIGAHTYYLPSYNFVVSPSVVSPENACSSLCIKFSNGTCIEGQVEYESCISSISSSTCDGPIPLAKKDGTLYYAMKPGNVCV